MNNNVGSESERWNGGIGEYFSRLLAPAANAEAHRANIIKDFTRIEEIINTISDDGDMSTESATALRAEIAKAKVHSTAIGEYLSEIKKIPKNASNEVRRTLIKKYSQNVRQIIAKAAEAKVCYAATVEYLDTIKDLLLEPSDARADIAELKECNIGMKEKLSQIEQIVREIVPAIVLVNKKESRALPLTPESGADFAGALNVTKNNNSPISNIATEGESKVLSLTPESGTDTAKARVIINNNSPTSNLGDNNGESRGLGADIAGTRNESNNNNSPGDIFVIKNESQTFPDSGSDSAGARNESNNNSRAGKLLNTAESQTPPLKQESKADKFGVRDLVFNIGNLLKKYESQSLPLTQNQELILLNLVTQLLIIF